MEKKIGFIGLGNMGKHMAKHLINSGHKMVLYDVNTEALDIFTEKNVEKAKSVIDVGDKAEIVIVSLPTPQIVKQVVLGDGELLKGKKIETFIDLSTSGPIVSKEVGETLVENNIKVLDSPVSGGVVGAINATLSLMVSGNKETLDECEYLLETFSKNIFYVGEELGQGQSMKVINNLLSSAALALTSEAVVLGNKAGLDSEIMIDVLNQSSGRNSATEDKFKKSILNRKFDYGFATSLAYKDMKLCMELAEQLDMPMYLGQNITHFWRHVLIKYGDKGDYTEVIKMFEEWSGSKINPELDLKVQEEEFENV